MFIACSEDVVNNQKMYLSVFYQYRFVVCPILTLKVPRIIITTVVYIGLETPVVGHKDLSDRTKLVNLSAVRRSNGEVRIRYVTLSCRDNPYLVLRCLCLHLFLSLF